MKMGNAIVSNAHLELLLVINYKYNNLEFCQGLKLIKWVESSHIKSRGDFNKIGRKLPL